MAKLEEDGWGYMLVGRLLATAAFCVRIQISLKIQNGRHTLRYGHQKNIPKR